MRRFLSTGLLVNGGTTEKGVFLVNYDLFVLVFYVNHLEIIWGIHNGFHQLFI